MWARAARSSAFASASSRRGPGRCIIAPAASRSAGHRNRRRLTGSSLRRQPIPLVAAQPHSAHSAETIASHSLRGWIRKKQAGRGPAMWADLAITARSIRRRIGPWPRLRGEPDVERAVDFNAAKLTDHAAGAADAYRELAAVKGVTRDTDAPASVRRRLGGISFLHRFGSPAAPQLENGCGHACGSAVGRSILFSWRSA